MTDREQLRSPDEGDGATRTDDSGPRPRSRDVLAPGESLGRYRIAEVLGAGGVGVVYRAHDPDLNRDVAVKVLQAATEGTPPAKDHERRLLREAQAMARLSHPNIVTVFDVGTFRGRVFLAMEYVDGGTLKQWLRAGGRAWRERLDAVIAAGRGLAEAHRAGVVHRDFKPDNVLVSKRGIVQVVDFGLARSVGEAEADASGLLPDPDHDALDIQLTRTGAVLGTPAYMSPEQFHGRPVDARSDQFAFAVVAFEALWGMRPFPGVTAYEVMRSVDSGASVRPPEGGDVPAALGAVIARGLRPIPAERYPTMKAFLDELSRAADRAAAAPRARRWAPIGAVALLLAAVAMVTVVVMRQPASPTDQRPGVVPAPPVGPAPPALPVPPAPPGPAPRIEIEVGEALDQSRRTGTPPDWTEALLEVPEDVREQILRELDAELARDTGEDGFDVRIKARVIEAIRRRVRETDPARP